jgi:hypothetical protein
MALPAKTVLDAVNELIVAKIVASHGCDLKRRFLGLLSSLFLQKHKLASNSDWYCRQKVARRLFWK